MTTSNFSYYFSQTINHDSNTDRFIRNWVESPLS